MNNEIITVPTIKRNLIQIYTNSDHRGVWMEQV